MHCASPFCDCRSRAALPTRFTVVSPSHITPHGLQNRRRVPLTSNAPVADRSRLFAAPAPPPHARSLRWTPSPRCAASSPLNPFATLTTYASSVRTDALTFTCAMLRCCSTRTLRVTPPTLDRFLLYRLLCDCAAKRRGVERDPSSGPVIGHCVLITPGAG